MPLCFSSTQFFLMCPWTSSDLGSPLSLHPRSFLSLSQEDHSVIWCVKGSLSWQAVLGLSCGPCPRCGQHTECPQPYTPIPIGVVSNLGGWVSLFFPQGLLHPQTPAVFSEFGLAILSRARLLLQVPSVHSVPSDPLTSCHLPCSVLLPYRRAE